MMVTAGRKTPSSHCSEADVDFSSVLEQLELRPVFIRNLDRKNFTMLGEDGRLYREVDTNLWMASDELPARLAYVSVGRHGGSIMLEPLFLRIGDAWYNISTGRKAPNCVLW